MPLWAQIGVGFFAFTVLVMVFGPGVTKRKFRRQFDALASALGRPRSADRDWPFRVPVSAGERPFELWYDFRTRSRAEGYRLAPTGHMLIATTKLSGTRWPLHQVDITQVDGWMSKVVGSKRATGDPDFDPRFIVTQAGPHVRDGWLDEPTRAAVGRFFGVAPPGGRLWVREGDLQFLMHTPWPAADGAALQTLLEHQAALATALEKTAR